MTALNVKDIQAALEQARSLAREFAQAVRTQFGSRLRRITLYGSAARGDWHEESDIDILVLLDEVTQEDGGWLAQQGLKMGILKSGMLIQPLPMALADFEKLERRERRFAQEVNREGIPL